MSTGDKTLGKGNKDIPSQWNIKEGKVDSSIYLTHSSPYFKIKVRQNEGSKNRITACKFVAPKNCSAKSKIMFSVSTSGFRCAPKQQDLPLGD